MRTAVVLPAPFGPSTPSTVPGRAAKSTPASAVVLPKRLTRPLASIALDMAFLPSCHRHGWPCHCQGPHRSLPDRRQTGAPPWQPAGAAGGLPASSRARTSTSRHGSRSQPQKLVLSGQPAWPGGDAPQTPGLRFGRFVWEAPVSTGPWGHRVVVIRAHSHLRASNHGRASDHLRASDADREQVLEFLKTAFVQGRLTMDELDARAGQALASRTPAELAAPPAAIPSGPAQALPRPPAPPAGVPAAEPVPAAARTPASAKAAVWAACVIAALPAVWAAFLTFYGGVVVFFVFPFSRLALWSGAPPRATGATPGSAPHGRSAPAAPRRRRR